MLKCPKCGSTEVDQCPKCRKGLKRCLKCGFVAHEKYFLGELLPSEREGHGT